MLGGANERQLNSYGINEYADGEGSRESVVDMLIEYSNG
jgi:hypothetical protein